MHFFASGKTVVIYVYVAEVFLVANSASAFYFQHILQYWIICMIYFSLDRCNDLLSCGYYLWTDLEFTIRQISFVIAVSERTIKRRLVDWNLSVRGRYSAATDEELISFVQPILNHNPLLGYCSKHFFNICFAVTRNEYQCNFPAVI